MVTSLPPLPPDTRINAYNFGPYLREIVNNTREILSSLATLGAQMAEDFTQLTQALSDLQTEVAAIATEMDTLFADLTNALGSGNQAAVDDATAKVQQQIAALQALGSRDMPPAPPPVPPPPGP